MNDGLRELADRLEIRGTLEKEEYIELIQFRDSQLVEYLSQKARRIRRNQHTGAVLVQGLVHLSNYCRNDCYYCGMRRENRFVRRYRMEQQEILDCCARGYEKGLRSFLLQGGEDLYYTEKEVAQILEKIKKAHSDVSITLSLGEKSRQVYKAWYEAGADCYLLRHGTAVDSHYKKLHPGNMSLLRKKQCLWEMKEIGYQVGTGFLIGTPYQTIDQLAEELLFLKQLDPQLVSIGPFIPAANTPFEKQRAGNSDLACYLLSLLRLILPSALLPAAGALTALDREGRRKALESGANAVAFDLTPDNYQDNSFLNGRRTGRHQRDRENLEGLIQRLEDTGYEIAASWRHEEWR